MPSWKKGKVSLGGGNGGSRVRRLSFPFFPLLFAVYPVLFLFAHNQDVASPGDVYAPVGVSLLCTLAVWGILSLVLRDGRKAALLTTLVLLVFFTDGRLKVGETLRYPMWCVVVIPCGWYVVRTRADLRPITGVLNLISACLLAICLAGIGLYALSPKQTWDQAAQAPPVKPGPAKTGATEALPDIYYIIMDAYARSDTLKEIYGFDNSEFIDFLSAKGFRVTPKSCSNYAWTVLSISSCLNMDYLDPSPKVTQDRATPRQMILHNRVEAFLESKGYTIVQLNHFFKSDRLTGERGDFAFALMETTALAPLARFFLAGRTRNKVLEVFEGLEEAARQKGPKFVYAHVLCPHPPYVFGPNGEPKSLVSMVLEGTTRERQRYVDQVQFVNKKARAAVEAILSSATVPPIIIIQADHGPKTTKEWGKPTRTLFRENMRILDAYYLPGDGKSRLYDSITPVNTFRTIFNCYFNTDYKLLPDRSYYTLTERPHDFVDVTDELK